MPYGESRKDGGGGASSSSSSSKASTSASPSAPARKNLPIRTDADYQGEELFFESGPHPGDCQVFFFFLVCGWKKQKRKKRVHS